MLRGFARTAWIGADGRIDDEYADIRILQKPAIEHPPRKIDDANPVGLTDRAQRALPDAHPAGMRDKTELRAFHSQSLILLLDRQRKHRSFTPRAAPRGGPCLRRHGCRSQGRNAPAAQDVKSLTGLVVIDVLARVLAHCLTRRRLAE